MFISRASRSSGIRSSANIWSSFWRMRKRPQKARAALRTDITSFALTSPISSRSGIEEGKVRKDIDIYPAVIMMWSSISGIISMANDKEEYLKLRFNMSKDEYLKKAFKMLLEGAL